MAVGLLMASNYQYIASTGVIVPDTSDLLTEVQSEYQNAFGQDLVVTANTPQGVLISAETLARAAVVANNADLANQINPNQAGGVFLDAIMALLGIARQSAQYSTAVCTLTGVSGTVIPAGSQAKDSVYGNLWQSVLSVTITGGSASVTFQAVEPGSLTANSGTITQIISTIIGWETITNPSAAIPGAATQSDQQARLYRINTLALQGMGLAEAITSRLYATAGVNSLSFLENISNTTLVIDDVTMVPHSLYVCIDGGTDTDVANTLTEVKDGGCDYNNGASGNPVSVPITNPFSGQTINVLFDRPDKIQILVKVFYSAQTSVQNPQQVITQAILDYAGGLVSGEQGLIVGQNVSCFELAGAINIESPALYIQNVQTSLISPLSYSNAEIVIEKFQKAVIESTSITVVPI